MLRLPPLPAWDAAHPMLVHIPIGILKFVPVCLALTLLLGWKLRMVGILTLLLMAIGTAGACTSVLVRPPPTPAAMITSVAPRRPAAILRPIPPTHRKALPRRTAESDQPPVHSCS